MIRLQAAWFLGFVHFEASTCLKAIVAFLPMMGLIIEWQ